MAPSRPRRLVLSLITTAVIFGFAELIALSVNPVFPRWGLPDTNAVIMTAHPTRLWGLAPGKRKNVSTTATVNHLGIRGTPVVTPRPGGEERIVILGDSTFFGHGVADDDTMSAVLQRRRANTSVINGGIPGYSTEQTRRLLDEVIWDLEPTLLVIGSSGATTSMNRTGTKTCLRHEKSRTLPCLLTPHSCGGWPPL